MPEPRDGKGHYFEEYSEYAKTLRIWLVAYGVGAPVVILSNELCTVAS
jgi:hypothetical protein